MEISGLDTRQAGRRTASAEAVARANPVPVIDGRLVAPVGARGVIADDRKILVRPEFDGRVSAGMFSFGHSERPNGSAARGTLPSGLIERGSPK